MLRTLARLVPAAFFAVSASAQGSFTVTVDFDSTPALVTPVVVSGWEVTTDNPTPGGAGSCARLLTPGGCLDVDLPAYQGLLRVDLPVPYEVLDLEVRWHNEFHESTSGYDELFVVAGGQPFLLGGYTGGNCDGPASGTSGSGFLGIHSSLTLAFDTFDGSFHDGGVWIDDLVLTLTAADCNGNGIPDADDLAAGTSLDCNGNLLPDECEEDCDGDGVPDSCQLAAAPELDCDGDGRLDACTGLDPAEDWDGDGVADACISANYCVATPNSSGATGTMSLLGSPVLAEDAVTLYAQDLPPLQPSCFLMSLTEGFTPGFAGSSGNLCLGAPIVRLNNGQVGPTNAQGARSIGLVLDDLPQQVTFAPGDTWHFQLWFRDVDPATGTVTSNTTDGIRATFR